jgi:hypothetical protein
MQIGFVTPSKTFIHLCVRHCVQVQNPHFWGCSLHLSQKLLTKIRLKRTGTTVIFVLGCNNQFLFQNTTLTVYLYVTPENALLCSYAGVKEHLISLIFGNT